jgi:hypothetical protein
LQLTTWLVETIKSGKVTVSQNNVEALEIKAQDKRIDVNATDKQFVKEIISSARGASGKKGAVGSIKGSANQIRVVRNTLPMLKEIAEDLCREGVTVTVSFKGDKVVTIGSGADSKLTRLITGTKGIEIDSVTKLIRMGI